jgi:hypothetical protein
MSEPIKPIREVAASGGIPGPKMHTKELMKTTDFSCYPVGKVPGGSPPKVSKEPRMTSKRK